MSPQAAMWDAMWDQLASRSQDASKLLGASPPVGCPAGQRTSAAAARVLPPAPFPDVARDENGRQGHVAGRALRR